MLPVAKLFKFFEINKTNNALVAGGVREIRYKRDNSVLDFSCRLEELAGESPFDFKYFTADGEAIFEIVTANRNGNLWEFTLKFLTHYRLGTNISERFFISGQTPHEENKLNMSVNEIIGAIGNAASLLKVEFGNSANFGFFIKIKTSSMPQNLYIFDRTDRTWHASNYSAQQRGYGSYSTNAISPPLPSEFEQLKTKKFSDYNINDYSYTFYIPVPVSGSKNQKSELKIKYASGGEGVDFSLTLNDYTFFAALSALITDITTSVDIVPCSQYRSALGVLTTDKVVPITAKRKAFSLRTDYTLDYSQDSILPSDPPRYVGDGTLLGIKSPQPYPPNGSDFDFYPVFWCETSPMPSAGGRLQGFAQNYDFIDIPANSDAQNILIFLGNEIELVDSAASFENERLWAKVNEDGIRIYTRFSANDFVDIDNSVEFDKNAFSNFQAYIKSNIALSNSQELAQLRLQQTWERRTHYLDQTEAGIKGISSAVSGGLKSGVKGAVTAGLTAALDMADSEVRYQMKVAQQNAQTEMSQKQALERASQTIVPGTTLKGAVNLSDIYQITNGFNTSFSFKYFSLTKEAQRRLYNYLITNKYIYLYPPADSLDTLQFPLFLRTAAEDYINIYVQFDKVNPADLNIPFLALVQVPFEA